MFEDFWRGGGGTQAGGEKSQCTPSSLYPSLYINPLFSEILVVQRKIKLLIKLGFIAWGGGGGGGGANAKYQNDRGVRGKYKVNN